jgi:hypothetical protein
MMLARTICPASTSASSGDSSVGRSGPQQASYTTAGGLAASPTAPPALPTAAEVWAGAPVAEAAPQMEATPPATMTGEAAPAAAAGATAGAPSAKPAAEEVTVETPVEAATVGAAAAEVAGAPSSEPQPAQGDEPEVVHGRRLLVSPVEVPLPRLLVKAQRAMEEVEAGFRREWEKLKAKSLRLSDWERHLRNRI